MASWNALNVEAVPAVEADLDDTKEIQIEEALKLYQTALKHHSEGPQSFDKTAEAYRALFESDIFKYNESLSEWKRHELFGDTLVFDTILQDDFEAGPAQAAGAADSAPNTLPQILHLSYKNHGQFLLETMQHWIRQHGGGGVSSQSTHILAALSYFAEALDKEDTDLDLWLRTASVAAMLGSQRITRFCLEAVLDGDDELFGSVLRLPGLEEGFAGQQLRELVSTMEDNLSLMQAPLSSMKRKKLSETLKKRLNPYPFAPLPSEVAKSAASRLVGAPPERINLSPAKWDWAGVGEAILRHYMAEQSGLMDHIPAGSSINISIPPDASVQAKEEEQEPASAPVIEDTIEVARPTEASRLPDKEPTTAVTKEPAAQENDVPMEDQETSTSANNADEDSTTPQDIPQSQSRKRSTDSAGLPETAEGGRLRSKRLRARETITDLATNESAPPDMAKQLEDQLWRFTHADQCLFEVVNDMFTRLGVEGLGSPKALREIVTESNPQGSSPNATDRVAYDMFTALQNGGAKIAPVLLSGEPVDLGGMSREAGLNVFLGHAKTNISQVCAKPVLEKEGLGPFALGVNEQWLSIKEVALAWLELLLAPGRLPSTSGTLQNSMSSYMQYRWAEDLKRHLVQIIVNMDDFIYGRLLDRIDEISNTILKHRSLSEDYQLSKSDLAQIEISESLFELHLDIYSLIKHPHSGVDSVTLIVQKDRLDRWSHLTRDAIQLRSDCSPKSDLDELALRHIWASVFHMSVSDEIAAEHVLYALEELKDMFHSSDGLLIEVQNNAVMPELSIAAVDRELARISMKDFFLKVFDHDEKDPVAVIESLEPILEPIQEDQSGLEMDQSSNDEDQADALSSSTVGRAVDPAADMPGARSSPLQEMRKFLDSASVSLRLSLWQRLREAYENIDYPPKVLSCYLRTIETLIGEFSTSTYQESALPERHVKLLSRFRIVDEVVVKILQIIKDEKSAFDCLSYEHMQTSMSAISHLLRIMSAANIFDDMVRVSQLPAPRMEGLPSGTYVTITTRLHDMQLRLWMLQYQLLREGVSQTQDEFPNPSDDYFEFLRHVHHATGVRGFCHSAGRLFLRLAKDEVLRLDDVTESNNRDTELSQLLYDLYGLRTFTEPLECQEFGTLTEILDKKTASSLLTFILSQTEKINIKDLPKNDLKVAIDKVHGALGRPKTNENISLNRKILTTFFKSPVSPVELFNCLKGVGSLSTKLIPLEVAPVAAKGWYFLMGNIALSKFRSQKRLTQGPTEDLNFAQAFFLQDLEYSIDRWETWYHLAQANDTQLEECISWNADKMNNGTTVELIHFQRAAIHCYTMAVASAFREADAAPQTIAKVSQLYADFGNRIYSSSREPFSMNAFNIRDTEHKFYSGSVSQLVYQHVPFHSLTVYTAWKFAGVLFRRAIKGSPDKWWNYYMLGKCLWKMYCSNADDASAATARLEVPPRKDGPSYQDVVDAFVSAIETLPEKKERGREPILEPHYKLVSIAHKLFQRKAIDHEKGAEIVHHTSYSRNLSDPENPDDWERYILVVLKALRTADKSAWHHRIIARSAHVIYDDSTDVMVAHGAKHELTQQMFTKTMAVQVWKPEYERPGRHFVYTTRYTKFFVHLLDQTGDKANFEALAKRVRRKQSDFFEHSKLWQQLCLRYLQMLRRIGNIPDGQEDAIFRALNHDEFSVQAKRLEAWCQAPTTQHHVLDVLRDVIELKRLNNGLMKPLLIDDLIGDTYGLLYTTVAPSLQPLPSEQQPPLQTGFATLPSQAPGPLLGSSLMQVQVDGAADGASSTNTPFSIYHPSQLQTQQTDPVARPRVKPVGRRELQRRAEACAQKLAGGGVVTTTPVTAIPIRSPPSAMHAQLPLPVRMSPEKAQNDPMASTTPNEQLRVHNSGTGTATTSVTNVESAPASIHDSADDESELSELDESEVQEIAHEIEQEVAAVHNHHGPALQPVTIKSLTSRSVADKEKLEDEAERRAGSAYRNVLGNGSFALSED
ncbi:transcriptional corepressor of histone-like protein genes [Massariosphaeria phaeospora]|uniref:Histone transcription regulator 3 homolog n=1 Tax=Massariosphaeria phaeospora TaxID=100035 RepID=A0A7C8I6U5_9PLEO|nr:transcriptional corepressor of histone-like protein genes [Massariosphaeria phaeospora]